MPCFQTKKPTLLWEPKLVKKAHIITICINVICFVSQELYRSVQAGKLLRVSNCGFYVWCGKDDCTSISTVFSWREDARLISERWFSRNNLFFSIQGPVLSHSHTRHTLIQGTCALCVSAHTSILHSRRKSLSLFATLNLLQLQIDGQHSFLSHRFTSLCI